LGLLLEILMQLRQYVKDRFPGFVWDIQSSEYLPPVGERSESLLDVFSGLEVFVIPADLHDPLARPPKSAARDFIQLTNLGAVFQNIQRFCLFERLDHQRIPLLRLAFFSSSSEPGCSGLNSLVTASSSSSAVAIRIKASNVTSPVASNRLMVDSETPAFSASVLKGARVVFNIGGNKYRVILAIDYQRQLGFIRFVGTHAQYDQINAETV